MLSGCSVQFLNAFVILCSVVKIASYLFVVMSSKKTERSARFSQLAVR